MTKTYCDICVNEIKTYDQHRKFSMIAYYVNLDSDVVSVLPKYTTHPDESLTVFPSGREEKLDMCLRCYDQIGNVVREMILDLKRKREKK